MTEFTLDFNDPTQKLYESGLDRGVLYVRDPITGAYDTAAVWYGLTSVAEAPTGAEPTDLYAFNEKYLTLISPEVFAATLEAYTYPNEFAVCDGSAEVLPGMNVTQQARQTFGLSYRTKVGSDIGGPDLGYKIILIYGALASPSDRNRATINESPEAVTFSWEFSTTPVGVTGLASTAKLVLDSQILTAIELAAIEEVLYGDGAIATPYLPLPDEVKTIIENAV